MAQMQLLLKDGFDQYFSTPIQVDALKDSSVKQVLTQVVPFRKG